MKHSDHARDVATYCIVVLLLLAAGSFLYVTVTGSAQMFERGISVAEHSRGSQPELAAHQIFVLALAHHVVTFKATALFIGAMTAILGALFVLRVGEIQYNARLGGAAWQFSLGTSSPGLVMITLGCALAAVAIVSKVDVHDAVPVRLEAQQLAEQEHPGKKYIEAAEAALREEEANGDGGD